MTQFALTFTENGIETTVATFATLEQAKAAALGYFLGAGNFYCQTDSDVLKMAQTKMPATFSSFTEADLQDAAKMSEFKYRFSQVISGLLKYRSNPQSELGIFHGYWAFGGIFIALESYTDIGLGFDLA